MKQETIHYLNLLGHTATGFHCNQYIFKNLLKSESLKFQPKWDNSKHAGPNGITQNGYES